MSIENDLLSAFIQRLNEHGALDEKLVDDLEKALTRTKLPKATELVSAISKFTGENVA